MLELCREFGFAIAIDSGDPRLRLVSRTLDPMRPSEPPRLNPGERTELSSDLRDIVGAWLLCALIVAFALGLSAVLRPPSPGFPSPMTAGLQAAPSLRPTCSLPTAPEPGVIGAPLFTPLYHS
jgi:hypothetical protein